MRANSLAFRLIVAASLWSVLAMAAAGVILSTLYRQNAEQAFDDRLHVYLNTLIGTLAAQDPAQPLSDPGNVGEQRFELLYSGWYWQVREPDNGAVLLTSRSLFSDVLDVTKAARVKEDAGIESGSFAGPDKQKLRFLSQTVTFDKARRFDVLVAGDAGNLEQQIASFRTTVIFLLGAFALGLIIATAVQIRWAFRPLDRVRRSLADLRSGKQTRFEEGLPAEIRPLVDELNALLESNREIVERARTQVGNLAHALKTPLSVITNEARSGGAAPFATKVAEQAETMRKQISHYLDRARIAGQVNVIGALTDVHPAVTRLVRAMNRIHGERGIRIDSRGAENARFRGEQQDLEEIVGNLVDNACKWARSQVTVTVRYAAPSTGDAAGRLTILIEDDGPGLTADQIAAATARGRRLDETKPGSGLGLSIVTDLVALYRGSFSLDASPLGGLRATVNLPAA
jgi:signal transduction histidine kinase